MSDLFFHEISCPDDRAIRTFLWGDYFHDATLERIDYGKPERRDVTLTVRVEKEQLLPQCKILGDTYFLRFHRLHHFRYTTESPFGWGEGVYSTDFQDSPLLHRLQAKSNKPLYHLRICTFAGLMDIVFERFTIRRKTGRIHYHCEESARENLWETSMQALGNRLDAEYAGVPDKELNPLALDDVLYVRLYRLKQAQDIPGAITLARRVLNEPPLRLYNAEGYAAHLLGYYGDSNDLPALTRIHIHPECWPYHRQIVQDAIERIMERAATSDR